MPNIDLKHRSYKIPDNVINTINQRLTSIQSSDKQAKGLQRAKDMVDKKVITYYHMNRLKNYFDNYEGDGLDDEYRLLGGITTKKWLEKSDLETEKESIAKVKDSKMAAGTENTHQKSGYTKDNDNANPTGAKGGMIDVKNSFKNRNIMANDAIYKSSTNENYNNEINSIKYLIEYLNKK